MRSPCYRRCSAEGYCQPKDVEGPEKRQTCRTYDEDSNSCYCRRDSILVQLRLQTTQIDRSCEVLKGSLCSCLFDRKEAIELIVYL